MKLHAKEMKHNGVIILMLPMRVSTFEKLSKYGNPRSRRFACVQGLVYRICSDVKVNEMAVQS